MTLSPVRLEERPGLPLAVIRRRVGPAQLADAVREACGAVWRILTAQGLRGGRNVALYWDDTIHLEAGVEYPAALVEQDGVIRSRTPPGLVAAVTHLGPYGGLAQAHAAILAWLPTHGHHRLGPRWEIYGHWQSAWEADPSQILTEVCYLVAPDHP